MTDDHPMPDDIDPPGPSTPPQFNHDRKVYEREMGMFRHISFVVQGASERDIDRKIEAKVIEFSGEEAAADWAIVQCNVSEHAVESGDSVVAIWQAEVTCIRYLGLVPWA